MNRILSRSRAPLKASLCVALIAVIIAALCLPQRASAAPTVAADELGRGFDESTVIDTTYLDLPDVGYSAALDRLLLGQQLEGGLGVQEISANGFQRLMVFAEQYKGWKYVWAGKYPKDGGFDCSGLVTWCYDNVFGLEMPGTYTNAERIYKEFCDPISAAAAKPGDLVFWRGTYGDDVNYISHVGIYCGGNLCYAAGDPIGYYPIDTLRNIEGEQAQYFFGSVKDAEDPLLSGDGKIMYRMFNGHSGEHFYTDSIEERENLRHHSWIYEGIGWVSPKQGEPIYRLYNPFTGDHHYTNSLSERDTLVDDHGWKYEGVGWFSGGNAPMLRLYNPNARVGAHHYTNNIQERDTLVRDHGWVYEGIGWYGA